jgi:acyl carrier protein
MSQDSIKSGEFPLTLGALLHNKERSSIALSRFDLKKSYADHFKTRTNHEKKKQSENKINVAESNYTEREYQIAQLFVDALGIEQISLHDDFFKLGVNSILAIRLSHQMSKMFEYEVRVADLFRLKNIKGLVENLKPVVVDVENIEKDF